ncbi:MAG TPA: hypothetical protein VF637_10560 [Sphingomicrobium sp.]|jgi:hypothetical protein
MQIAGVTNGFRPIASLLRMVALAVFAVLLLTRLGPFCEATAQAASIASSMSGCEGKGMPASEKKGAQAACATPCMAVPGEVLARVEPLPITAVPPWPAHSASIEGWPVPPTTPPPRSV